MAFDYGPKVEASKIKIRDKGKQITLVKIDSADADPLKPWSASRKGRKAAGNRVCVFAVQVPLSSSSDLGLKTTKEGLMDLKVNSLYIAEVGEDDPEGLQDYQILEDDGVEMKIVFSDKLKPGDKTILYYFGAES